MIQDSMSKKSGIFVSHSSGWPARPRRVSHLQHLEAEAIFVLRAVAADSERPVLLFSGGKDTIVASHLAQEAFFPRPVPFPLMHIDAGHNFPETILYRDRWIQKIGAQLLA